MMYLLLSIFFSSSLIIILKYFERFKIEVLQAIVVNYIAAAILGYINNKSDVLITDIPYQQWSKMAIVLGTLFISVFYIIALATIKTGVSATTVAFKMSLIIPVIAAILLYNDSVSIIKIIGIILALAAVYFTSGKNEEISGNKFNPGSLFLLIIVFIGSGIIDTLVNYSQANYLNKKDELDIFISLAFSVSGFIGLLIIIYQRIFSQKSFKIKSVIAGILLGVLNYGAIYTLIKSLDSGNCESSVLFSINNTGIVLFSTMCAFLLFKEKLSKINWIGIGLSVIAIALIAFF